MNITTLVLLSLLYMLLITIISACEATEELVSVESIWESTIFYRWAKGNPGAYFGWQGETYKRKHRREGTFWHKLDRTVLVGFTDVWHGADLVAHFTIFFVLLPSILWIGLCFEIEWWYFLGLSLGGWAWFSFSFHMFYHNWLRK